MIKLLATDIDGTLLKYDCTCGIKTKNTIKKLDENGIKVILATGRMYDGALGVAKQFGLKNPCICYQGAMVRDEEKILWQAPVKLNIARKVIEVLRKKKIHTNLYNNERLYVEHDDKKIMEDYSNKRFIKYDVVNSFDEIELGDVHKLLAVIYDEEKLLEFQKEMTEMFKGELVVVRSHKYYCEFTDINATKGTALDFLKEYYGLQTSEVMSAGDQDNDYDLLAHAGIKIAMENGVTGIKKIADYICPNVNDEGLCDAIERYILCGLE